jgi:pimeloyl-ACP methyl ester carboxylesterase
MSLDPEVGRISVETGSGPLAALVGEPPTGAASAEPVLLVPGYTGSKEDFLPVLGPLARAGHRAVAIDLRGQFESEGSDDPAPYTIDALAKDVGELLAGLGPDTHLVGHSFGGLVTRATILAGARPRTHVLVGSGPAALGGRRAEVIPLMLQIAQQDGMAALGAASAEMDRADPKRASTPTEVNDFLFQRWAASSATGLKVMGEALLTATDQVEELAAAGVPTLVIHGEDDDAWPPAVQKEMAHRLGADHVAVPGSVHSPACEEPEAFVVALLRYWRG